MTSINTNEEVSHALSMVGFVTYMARMGIVEIPVFRVSTFPAVPRWMTFFRPKLGDLDIFSIKPTAVGCFHFFLIWVLVAKKLILLNK